MQIAKKTDWLTWFTLQLTNEDQRGNSKKYSTFHNASQKRAPFLSCSVVSISRVQQIDEL